MRLTLRTMLAYLDDILEPEDAEDISKKIAESDFASSLVHRMRDCVRRVRLGTPALEGKGLAADGNTVAEYLDNTLAAERVPEFEKVCLESDVHLSEVASCHQILTLVLGEPADVKGLDRSRMYEAISQGDAVAAKPVEPRAVASPPVHRTPSPVDTPETIAVTKRTRPEVPDYLRESTRSRRKSFLVTMIVSAAVVLALLWVAGPPELREQVARWTGRGAATPEVAQKEASSPPDLSRPQAADQEPSTAQTPDNAAEVTESTKDEPPLAVASETEVPTEDSAVEPVAVPRTIVNPGASDNLPIEPAPENADVIPPAPENRTIDNVPNDLAIPAPSPEVMPELPTDPATDNTVDPSAPANPLRTGTAAPIDIADGVGAEVGRYMDDSQVAVKFDRETNSWKRLPAKEVISAGDRVICLPPFRPTFALKDGTTVQILGPTELQFAGLDEHAVPVLAIEYGKLELLSLGNAGNRVHLKVANQDIMVTLVDAQSTMVMEAAGFLPLGMNPEEGPAQMAVDIYASSGELLVVGATQEITVKAPEHITITDFSASGLPQGQLPNWATRDLTTALERRGADEIRLQLVPEKPLSLAMKEAAESRRQEVRAAATRCGAYLGDFEPFVSALTDEDQRAYVQGNIDTLRSALARGPQTAALVRETFEKKRGADAAILYRMLCGYTPDQLTAGEDVKLVGMLDSDALDIRRLAFWNLKNISGKDFSYVPEYPPARRKVPTTRWKDLLKSGGLIPPKPAAAAGETSARRSPTSQPLR